MWQQKGTKRKSTKDTFSIWLGVMASKATTNIKGLWRRHKSDPGMKVGSLHQEVIDEGIAQGER
jgi:hypothetical protein